MNYKVLSKTALFLVIPLSLLNSLFNSPCFSDDVYKWTDEQGKVHFSNEQKKVDAQKAELPQIEKENFEEKINDLKTLTNQTCLNRGGINCEAGKDSDGSVLCMDGFKDSAEIYDELCTEVKLTYEIVLPPKNKHKKLSFYPIKVQARNTTGINARDVSIKISLLYHLAEDRRYLLTLEGPNEISPFGIAEYTYIGKNIDERILRKAHVQIQCKNCWNPSKPKP